jgi:Arc/MetJ-type ribon-helix-helix transcriptional regulator
MATTERVTVTLPVELVRDIDRVEENRSKFIAEAVRHELERRQRDELRRSLAAPHPDTAELAEAGMTEWAHSLPDEDAEGLVDMSKGKPVRWIPDRGWVEVNE